MAVTHAFFIKAFKISFPCLIFKPTLRNIQNFRTKKMTLICNSTAQLAICLLAANPVSVIRAMAVVALHALAWRLRKYRAMFVAASF